MPKIDNYYNRFDESLGYDEILFRDGYGAQGAEQNEQQAIINAKIAKLGRALFKDGDIVNGAQIVVDPVTGKVMATAGTIFLNGFIWNVPAGEMDIPVTGTVSVGIHLEESVISELEDPALRNPARGQRSEGEPGAWRRKVVARWGFDSDGETGTTFYPVYTVDDGVQRAKEAPPALDSFNLAIARYDRDSTGGGTYASSGFTAIMDNDLEDGRQVYVIKAGRARIGGLGMELPTDKRVIYPAEPDLRTFGMEICDADASSQSETGQRVDVAHAPLKSIHSVRITVEETVSVVHGTYTGCVDALPVTGVTTILSINQLETEFELNTDFVKKGDQVDWSPLGNEPAAGSTYMVKLRHLLDIEPENIDLDGFSVKGAVPGTQIIYSYDQMLPRYDRMALDAEGMVTWFKGIASENNPQIPAVPESLLPVATVYQNWRASRELTNDAPRVIPFEDIAAMNRRLDYALQEISRNRLEADAATRESGAKVGIFVDPLDDDSMRDQGLPQTGSIINGELRLPIVNAQALLPSRDVEKLTARPFTPRVAIEQPYRTGEMAVNPYMAFEPMPANVKIVPAVDQWLEEKTIWTTGVSSRFAQTSTQTERYRCPAWLRNPRSCAHQSTQGWRTRTRTVTTYTYASQEMVSQTTTNLQYLRQLDITFEIDGFGPGEELQSITFDGISVIPQGA